jgi:3-methyladenine DNA glycosylase AlkC
MSHPFLQFQAPTHIAAGSCLADLFNATSIGLIGESFAAISPGFSRASFEQEAGNAAKGLTLKAKVAAIASVIRRHLPKEESTALDCLRGAWGPPLERTEKNGLAPLIYMPLGVLLEGFSSTQDDAVFRTALEANFELTTRFTAEFSIRPYLEARQTQTLAALKAKLQDPNPHVRRLISEGTRPRLPWASQLTAFRSDPTLCLPLLAALRDDPCRYVTRSVANHLGDIGKDHPEVLFQTCTDWLHDLKTHPPSETVARERQWLVRHALRHPAKKGNPRALKIRERAGTLP